MSARDLLGLVGANLKRMRARVALTAIGVIIGTAAVIVLISLGVGLQQSATSSLGEFGEVTTIRVFGSFPFGGMGDNAGQAEKDVKLTDEVLRTIRAMPHVVAVTPRLSLSGQAEFKIGRDRKGGQIVGIDPKAAPLLGWKMATGSARLARGQMIVGPKVFADDSGGMMFVSVGGARSSSRSEAAAASTPKPPPMLQGRALGLILTKFDDEGNEITRNERVRVVGVFEESGGQSDYEIYMSQDDVDNFNTWFNGKRRNPRDGYFEVTVKTDAREHVTEVQNAIRRLGFNDMFSAQQVLESLNTFFGIMQLVLGGIGAVALLVAAFGIANTMTMAIYERTKEIGLMKALGATNRDVLQIFLAEAGAIGLVGGLVGTAMGLGLGKLIALWAKSMNSGAAAAGPGATTPQPDIVQTPLWLLAFAIVFATFIGILSGIYPALRAASMRPLRALRTE